MSVQTKTLKEIFASSGNFAGTDIGCNDKGSVHSYIETYEKILAPYRKGCKLLEIGIAMGDSIKMWNEYFDNSDIIGVDISLVCEIPPVDKNNLTLLECDATKPSMFEYTILNEGGFDIVIDDGEHTQQSQIATFNLLKDRMNKGGIYIIEDILNPEMALPYLKALHDNCEVVDLRSVKGRFDDMILIYRF